MSSQEEKQFEPLVESDDIAFLNKCGNRLLVGTNGDDVYMNMRVESAGAAIDLLLNLFINDKQVCEWAKAAIALMNDLNEADARQSGILN